MKNLGFQEQESAWYRHSWPWLLMLGPAVVIVAGAVTVWLAVTSNDGLVEDDYYKQGLAINQTLARADEARRLAVIARVRVDAKLVTVRLSAYTGSNRPGKLKLAFAHPTRSGQDHVVELAGDGELYEGLAPLLSSGRWQLVLEDGDRSWRLAGQIRIPDESEIELRSAP